MIALLKFEPHRYPSGQTSGAPQPPSHAELLDAINDLVAQLRLLAERVLTASEQATTHVPVPPPNGAAQAPALVASPVSGDIMACIHDCIQNPTPDIRQADDGTLELLLMTRGFQSQVSVVRRPQPCGSRRPSTTTSMGRWSRCTRSLPTVSPLPMRCGI